MDNFSWEKKILTAFKSSIEKYRSGDQNLDKFFSDKDLKYFSSIGYKSREFFDFVEDYCDIGAPSIETAILFSPTSRLRYKKCNTPELDSFCL
jgi:hypothetical protein